MSVSARTVGIAPECLRVFTDYDADFELEADAVVVGSGPCGAVVAHSLAEAGHSVVLLEEAVALGFGQQDPVGHQFHAGVRPDLVGESDGIADRPTDLASEFGGDPFCDGAGSDTARLGMADEEFAAAPEFQAELGKLGALARPGLTGNDHDLVAFDGGE